MSRTERLLAHAAALGFTLFAAGCHASLPGPATCDASSRCAEGETCTLGRCRDAGSLPASTLATRLQLRPTGWRLRGAPPLHDGGSSPEEFVIHGERGETQHVDDEVGLAIRRGETRLVLEFGSLPFARRPAAAKARASEPSTAALEGRAIERALVVFEPQRISDATFGLIDVEVALESAPGPREDAVESAREARASLPMRLGTFVATPGAPLVLDVTELVRIWEREHRGAASLEVGALPRAGVRASYALGRLDAGSPRLEVYLAPSDAERAAARASAHTTSASPAHDDDRATRAEETE